jgi:RNA polymerase sigma factor (sigma-70 family)
LVDDMAAEALVSLVRSLKTFDTTKNSSLGAHVLQRMRWAVLDALRVLRPGSRWNSDQGVFFAEVELDENVAALPSSMPTADTDRIDLARAVEQLPPKRRVFIEAYLKCGDAAEAAATLGMSKESGWQHHWQAVQFLRKYWS